MHTALERLITERREWRERRWRRLTKVSERCHVGWRNFCTALHREIVLHNSLGRDVLGIHRGDGSLAVHRPGQLLPLLSFTLDHENGQILYRSPMHSGSVMIDEPGSMMPAFLGSLFVMTPDGNMMRFSYIQAAQYLLSPLIGD